MDLKSDVKPRNICDVIDINSKNCDSLNEACSSNAYGERYTRLQNRKPQAMFASSLCCTTMRLWWRSKFARFEEFLHTHQWKVLSSVLLLILFCLGLKMVNIDTDFDKLWVEESDRLISEWTYLAQALKRVSSQTAYADQHYFGSDARRTRMMLRMNAARAPVGPILDPTDPLSSGYGTANIHGPNNPSNSGPLANSLPGREFMGTMETILQSATRPTDPDWVTENEHTTGDPPSSNLESDGFSSSHSDDPQLLTPQALLDHMEFLIKVRRLQITVGSAKWSFKDLCQRATLPFGSEVHPIQAYLDMIIPCVIITPLDCFWEGAKVLGPEEATWVPWLGERTLIQWPHLDPVGLLQELRRHYGNQSHYVVDSLIAQFQAAGINHGYLNRTCLDPTDPACPISAPNYRGRPPNVAEVLSGGCPSFAANVLHWSEEIIVGGRAYRNSSIVQFQTTDNNRSTSTGSVLVSASAFQSLILLRSPRDLYEAVRHSDPYKHEGWTLADAQHVLDEWRRNLRRLVMEHNVGLQPDSNWHFYAFTDNSLRDLLRELTHRLGPVKIVGCVLLVFLYGLVCLLGWRDPVRSQCWLALTGLFMAALSAVAGLGICAVIGLPFNVLTIQVLPFLLMGLGVDGVFTLTTCHDCCVARRATCSTANPNVSKSSSLTPWASSSSIATCSSGSTGTSSTYYSSLTSATSYTAPVLAQHGPSLLYGTIAIAGAFFSAAYIPIPLMRQFCLQAGILVLVQAVTAFLLFPVLLQFDGIRRSQRRLDVLCCLRHPAALDTTTTSLLRPINHPSYAAVVPGSHALRSRRHVDRRCGRNSSTTVPSSPLVCSVGTRPSHTHTHGTNTTPSSAVPSSSIQVNVINHLTPMAGDHVTDVTCSSVGGADHACGLSGSHTVRATVTVQGLGDKAQTSTTTTTTAATKPDRSVPDVQCSNRTKKCCPAHPRVDTSNLTVSQNSVLNRAPHSHAPNRTLVSRIGLIERSPRSSNPLLVRFSRRLALVLTCHWSIQALVCVLSCSLFVVAGCILRYCLHLGLDWASLTPMDTVEYGFVKASEKAFGLYNFQLIARGTDLPGSRPPLPPPPSPTSQLGQAGSVPGNRLLRVRPGPAGRVDSSSSSNGLTRSGTNVATIGRGIDFPMQQRRLQHLYTRLLQLPGVMLAGRQVWLISMRDWLQQVQDAFDADRARGQITEQGEWSANATELGVLGLRLIVQTDRGPELGRIKTGRLVHGGIVDPPAFYVLLRVWRTYDALNFSSLACVIHPEPTPLPLSQAAAVGPGRSSDLYALPPAEPIEFVQTNFYAHGIRGMGVQLELVRSVRHLTESATIQGVPAFPIGVPFTFAEHYLYLLNETGIACGIFTSILLVAGLILFSSPIIVLLLLVIGAGGGFCAAICGLYLLGLELNPISTGLLLFSGGLGARLAAGFLGAWPDLHSWNRVGRASTEGTKFCLCRRPDCSSVLFTQYCTVLGTEHGTPFTEPVLSIIKDQPHHTNDHATASSGSSKTSDRLATHDQQSLPPQTFSSAPADRLGPPRCQQEQRRQRARAELVRLMCNQLSPALHTTVGLILALALLAAARVQFIANYFFYLIAFVSLICLFNTIFLIPTLYYWLHPFKEAAFYGDYYLNRRTARASVEPCLRHFTTHPNGLNATAVELPGNIEPPPVSQPPVTFPSSVSASSLSSSSGSASSSAGSCASSSNSCQSPKSIRSSPSSVSVAIATPDPQRSHPLPRFDYLADRGSLSKSHSPLVQSTSDLYELCGVRLRDVTQSLHRNLNWLDTATAAAAVVAAAAAAAVASASSSSPPRHPQAQPPSRPASLSTISEEPSHSSSTVSLNRISPGTSSNSNPSNDTTGSSPATAALDLDQSFGGSSPVPPQHLLFDVGHLLTLDYASKPELLYSKLGSEIEQSPASHGLESSFCFRSTHAVNDPLSYKTETSPPPSYSSVVNPQLPVTSTHMETTPSEVVYDPALYSTRSSHRHYPCFTPLIRPTPSDHRDSSVAMGTNRSLRRKSSRSRLSRPNIPTTVRTNPQVRLELHHHHHHHHYSPTAPENRAPDDEDSHHHRQQKQHPSSGSQTPRSGQ